MISVNRIKEVMINLIYTIYWTIRCFKSVFISVISKKPVICFDYNDGMYSDFYINIYRELLRTTKGYTILLLFKPNSTIYFDKRFDSRHFAPVSIIHLIRKYVILTARAGSGKQKKHRKTVQVFHGFGAIGAAHSESFFEGFDKMFIPMVYHYEQLTSGSYKNLVPKENIAKVGYPKIDGKILPISKEGDKKKRVVFYGPTYHVEISSIFEYLLPIVKYTQKNDMILLIKLHPFLYHKDDFSSSGAKDWVSEIKALSRTYNNIFHLNRNISFEKVREYFYKSDIFLTDDCGVGLEYSLITGRPLVFLGNKLKIPLDDLRINNLSKYSDFPEIKVRGTIGPIISTPKSLDKKLDLFIKNYDTYSDSLVDFRKEFTYNLGKAAPFAATEVLNLLNTFDK